MITNIKAGIGAYKEIEKITTPGIAPAGEQAKPASFGDTFKQALSEIDQLQKSADAQSAEMITGNSAAPHEAMIALEKADLSFQLMNQIRTKIIRAYEEVLRTQI